MQRVGVIMSYESYQEYHAHRQEMVEKGYVCMDYIPEGMAISSYQFIRYRLEEIHS